METNMATAAISPALIPAAVQPAGRKEYGAGILVLGGIGDSPFGRKQPKSTPKLPD